MCVPMVRRNPNAVPVGTSTSEYSVFVWAKSNLRQQFRPSIVVLSSVDHPIHDLLGFDIVIGTQSFLCQRYTEVVHNEDFFGHCTALR